MAENSKIEWTDATWNPVLGCDKISPGCKGCYAIRTAWRLQHNPNPKVAKAFEGLTVMQGGKPNWTGRVNFVEERLKEPMIWKNPKRVFVNSQSDLFHENVSDDQIDKVFAVMAMCPQHTFQILTKRPARMQAFLSQEFVLRDIMDWQTDLRDSHFSGKEIAAAVERQCKRRGDGTENLGEDPLTGKDFLMPNFPALEWPLKNVWLGVSVENQQHADERIPLLLQTPAAVRWISAEPLLGPIDFYQVAMADGDSFDNGTFSWGGGDDGDRVPGIDWVVAGGESGPNARPMHPDWARSLRDQCKAAGVPFFFKQWGEWMNAESAGYPELSDAAVNNGRSALIALDGTPWNKVSIPHEKRDGAKIMMRVGKKSAGRKLDGVEHNEYPLPPNQCNCIDGSWHAIGSQGCTMEAVSA